MIILVQYTPNIKAPIVPPGLSEARKATGSRPTHRLPEAHFEL